MSDLVLEIQKLSLMKANTVYPVFQGEDVIYLNRGVSSFAIAIPFDDEREFDESFVGISLCTSYLNYENKNIKVLYLNMNETGDIKKFSYIGAEFIDIENRASLISNPYVWVDTWKEMFGDSKKKYMITDVLAELLSLKIVFEKDKSAKWQGPKDGTHDIVCDGGVIEVKSTTNKTNNYISINSRFQINPQIDERIYFVRLEPKPYSLTIDSIVDDLVKMGYPLADLEDCLREMGYRKGNRTRKVSYGVLSVVSYKVDSSTFPALSLDDLNNLTESKNIIGYKLTIDLSNIEGITIL